MSHPVLIALQRDEFLIRFGVTSNARALHRALERSEEVAAVRLALYQGPINDEILRGFVEKILQQLQPGVLFPYDGTLAAVAVVVEYRPTHFADQFLSLLSRLNHPELPLAIRVGRECLRVHL